MVRATPQMQWVLDWAKKDRQYWERQGWWGGLWGRGNSACNGMEAGQCTAAHEVEQQGHKANCALKSNLVMGNLLGRVGAERGDKQKTM